MSKIHSIQPDGTVIHMPDDSASDFPTYKDRPEVMEALKWKSYHNENAFDRRRIEPIYVYEDVIETDEVWG